MGLLSLFRRLNRKVWHYCYECVKHMSAESEPDAAKAIFYDADAPEVIDGRSHHRCPRCNDLNTISFQYLKDTRQDSVLFGLEQIAKDHPQSLFEVKRTA